MRSLARSQCIYHARMELQIHALDGHHRRSLEPQSMHACDRQTDRQTDGQTDRILIARPRPHSMQRGKKYKKFY